MLCIIVPRTRMEFEKNVTCFAFETDVLPNNFSLSKPQSTQDKINKTNFFFQWKEETIKIHLG